MADGSEKNIEELQIGDVLLGMDGAHNKVIRMEVPKLKDRPENDRSIYAFNGGDFFVTSEHPFMLETGQWASINPPMTYIRQPRFKEKYGEVKKLEIGDVIVRLNGEKETIEKIESRDRYSADMPVYNPTLDGNSTYYANGFLVHNRN